MTITVSISQFRDNIADYLDKIAHGATIIIKDEKKGQKVAQVTHTPTFDSEAYGEALRKAAGSLNIEKHPEWATIEITAEWLRKTRSEDWNRN